MNATLALHWPGTTEWVIIGILGLLLFGRRLPQVGRGVGQSIAEFVRGLREAKDAIEADIDDIPALDAPRTRAAPGTGAETNHTIGARR